MSSPIAVEVRKIYNTGFRGQSDIRLNLAFEPLALFLGHATGVHHLNSVLFHVLFVIRVVDRPLASSTDPILHLDMLMVDIEQCPLIFFYVHAKTIEFL